MQNRSRLPLVLLVGTMLCHPTVITGQTVPRMKPVITQKVPATSARPVQKPATGQRVTGQPVVGARQLEPGRLNDRFDSQVVARSIADCAAKPTVEYGEMLAGKRTTIRFADATNSRGRPVAVVNGEPIYKPDLAAANQPRPIMPRLQKLSITYRKVMVSSEPNTMVHGWYSPPVATFSMGTIIKDNRDGTAEVILPEAPDAIFAQQVTLTVVTDRCTIEAPLAIRPPTHIGRWFPPTLIDQCMTRHSPNFDVFGTGQIDLTYKLEQQLPSRRPIENAFRPNSLFHNCGPYGAVHEGGNDEGAGSGSGIDRYFVWDGGFDPEFSVLVTKVTDAQGQSCVTDIRRTRRADGGSHIGDPGGGITVAAKASRSVLEVQVSWRITQPHGYCWYALVAKGRHPVSLGDSWNTRFFRNNLGFSPTMIHAAQKTDLIWAKDIGDGKRQRQILTAAF